MPCPRSVAGPMMEPIEIEFRLFVPVFQSETPPMKSSVLLGGLFLMSGVVAVAALVATKSQPSSTIAQATPVQQAVTPGSHLTLSIPDMSCEVACAPKVRRTLADVPGVGEVETNIDDHTATFLVEDGFQLAAATTALEKAGFPASVQAATSSAE